MNAELFLFTDVFGFGLVNRGAHDDDELHPMFKWAQHFCPCFSHTSYLISNCGRCN
jgi:hypothetical protein